MQKRCFWCATILLTSLILYVQFNENFTVSFDFREKIETILQETLFEPRALLEQTVAEAMSQTLEIRDAVLKRTKDIRTGEGDVTICPEQGVNQEQFLAMIRMDIMTVLLTLIEPNAATPEKLQVSPSFQTFPFIIILYIVLSGYSFLLIFLLKSLSSALLFSRYISQNHFSLRKPIITPHID